MKKLFPLVIMLVAMLLVVGCGCGDDSTEEETPAPTPTMTEEPTPTSSPEPTPEVTPTTTPTQEATPTATPEGDSVEAVLAPVSSLILAYAEVNGEWQGYRNPDAGSIATLESGSAYWIYAAEEVMPEAPGFVMALNKGWQEAGPIAWMAEDSAAATALQADKDKILFVVGFDNQSKKFTAYMSPSVSPMTEILPGQEYCVFAGNPPAPQETCQTR
ncbi:MAG: hypothetical protein R6U37_05900 [Dehalococcoidia bacterium]